MKLAWRPLTLVSLAIVAAFVVGLLIRPSGIHDPADRPAPSHIQPTEHQHETLGGTVAAPDDPLTTYPTLPYWSALVPTGTICFEVRGSTYATQAALDVYYNTDAKVLPARSNCNGYASTNHIRLRGVDMGESTCAITTNVEGYGWTKRNVRGIEVWVREAPEIRFNTNPVALRSCFGSAYAARHTYGHEILHAIGMKHNWDVPSLVASKPPADSGYTNYSWKYDRVTSWDRAEIGRRY
jgi:hypothetical protein